MVPYEATHTHTHTVSYNLWAALRSGVHSGIRYQVSYLDWGTFSHRLFLQAPSKQKGKEKSTKQRQKKKE